MQRTIRVGRKRIVWALCVAAVGLGSPRPLDAQKANAIAVGSYNFPDRYIRHQNALGELTTVTNELNGKDATFRLGPGLSGGDTISFESVNLPGHFLCHQGFRIKL